MWLYYLSLEYYESDGYFDCTLSGFDIRIQTENVEKCNIFILLMIQQRRKNHEENGDDYGVRLVFGWVWGCCKRIRLL